MNKPETPRTREERTKLTKELREFGYSSVATLFDTIKARWFDNSLRVRDLTPGDKENLNQNPSQVRKIIPATDIFGLGEVVNIFEDHPKEGWY